MNELEAAILKYLEERDWDKLRPSDLAKSVSIEAAELLEIFQWFNPSLEETKADAKKMAEIKKELADVMIYCIQMAALLGLDTEQIIREKLEHVIKKYPAHLFKGKVRDNPGTDEAYLNIKKEYRRQSL